MFYKIWRSINSDFAAEPVSDLDDETCHADEVYTDAVLKEIADSGFNAIWVHALLHHVACAAPFETISPHPEAHQQHLHTLCNRALKYEIRVFLYAQPLRAIPHSNHAFWERYASVCGGSEYADARSLCISAPIVKKWLEDLSENLASALPDICGLILITASELPGHCYSAWQRKNESNGIKCTRCCEREPEDIVVDQLTAVHNGIRRKSKALEIVAWNWSWSHWHGKAPFTEILSRLPSDIAVMADFERGAVMDFWNHPGQKINEYCLSCTGPSDDCRKVISYAQARSAKTLVKLQIGTTHELASVVSLPLISNIYKKIDACKHMNIDGFMGCWNFGNFFSANTACAEFFLSDQCPDDETEAMKSFVRDYFGQECDSTNVTNAYKMFAEAMYYFPFSNMFIYNGPTNYALAYSEVYRPGPLSGKSCGPSHLHVPDRGDSLKFVFDYASMGYEPYDCFSLEETLDMLQRLTDAWNIAAYALEDSLRSSPSTHAGLEVNNALLIGKVWESTLHAFQSYAVRSQWSDDKMPILQQIISREAYLCTTALPLLEKDPRQGWHGEAQHYLFSAKMIKEKIQILNRLFRSGPQ